MANATYPKFKEALMRGQINLATGTVNAMLVDLDEYAFSAAHDFLNDIPQAARIGTPLPLTDKVIAGARFDAADVTFPAVPAGGTASAILIYVAAGTEATSPLVAIYDDATGLPVNPNGGDMRVVVNVAGLFDL